MSDPSPLSPPPDPAGVPVPVGRWVRPEDDVLVWVAHPAEQPGPGDCEVGDGWFQGFLEQWRRDRDHWSAYVRYTVAPGYQYLRWVSEDLVRPVVLPADPEGARRARPGGVR